MRKLYSIGSIVVFVGIGLFIYGLLGLKYDPSDAIESIHNYISKFFWGILIWIIGVVIKCVAATDLKEQEEARRHQELIDTINKNKKGD